jgi:hypothetical protein
MIGLGILIFGYMLCAILIGAFTLFAYALGAGRNSVAEAIIVTIITGLAWPIALLYFMYDWRKNK